MHIILSSGVVSGDAETSSNWNVG